ncbi:hypothetical protein [Cellulosimicrobium sp. Marseille-Q8652]
MTTTRRRITAVLLGAALAASGATGAAASTPAPPGPTGDGVRVTVEITEREVPASPRVVVVGDGPFVAGEPIVVRGSGLPPRAALDVWLLSDPLLLGTVTTGSDGRFELTATLPADTAPGTHRIRATAAPLGVDVSSDPFEVVAPTVVPGDPVEPGAPADPGDGAVGGGPSASPRPGGLAATGAGLAGVVLVAGAALGAGAVLRRRAARAGG